MTLKLFNTLGRQKQEFQPMGQTVGMYCCGPTVYAFAHVGNLRTYVFEDVLRRVLEYDGYALNQVMNITDVGHLVSDEDEGEDKMILAMKREGKSALEIAAFYTAAFLRDLSRLNIEPVEIICKATDHIPEMLALIQLLDQRGHAYSIDDGVYFDVKTFPSYGALSGLDLEGQEAGARVEVNQQKHNASDFALWKRAAPNHLMQWDSQFGRGFPGWHIECSAMSMKYLGNHFDIHCGGVDHIPIHHENEIAQSEGATGEKFVNYWLHGEFLQMDGGKMSKSLGNLYTLDDLAARGVEPLSYRYFLLNAHYRTKLNYTWEALEAQQRAYRRLREFVGGALAAGQDGASLGDTAWLEPYHNSFVEAINDDLNMPRALGLCWELIAEAKRLGSGALLAARQQLLDFDRVLGLGLGEVLAFRPAAHSSSDTSSLDDQVNLLIAERKAARANKDFKRGDEIRDELKGLGIELIDKPGGITEWRKAD